MQCIAICPEQALSWNKVLPIKFNDKNLPNSENLDELFKQRRTIRKLKNQTVDRTLLKELANYAMYAPTHSHDFRIIIIDDQSIIDKIDNAILHFIFRMYVVFFRPRIIKWFLGIFPTSIKTEFYRAKPKLENALKIGKGFKYSPPAIIFIIDNKRVPFARESAQYALYTVNLMAQSKGLACRNLVGNQGIINRSKSLRKIMSIGSNENIFGAMAIGYPDVFFKNKIPNRTVKIQWNEQRSW